MRPRPTTAARSSWIRPPSRRGAASRPCWRRAARSRRRTASSAAPTRPGATRRTRVQIAYGTRAEEPAGPALTADLSGTVVAKEPRRGASFTAARRIPMYYGYGLGGILLLIVIILLLTGRL